MPTPLTPTPRLRSLVDSFIKKYCFKDSIEEAIVALHEKIKSGDVKVVDGRFVGTAANNVISDAGKSMTPHSFDGPVHDTHISRRESGSNVIGINFITDARERESLQKKHEQDNQWQRWFKVRECKFCGRCQDVPGSSTYSGTGLFSYLNDLTRDPPLSKETCFQVGTGRFAAVPRPPTGWMGLQKDHLDNGEDEPEDGFGEAPAHHDLSVLKEAILKVYDVKLRDAKKATADSIEYQKSLARANPNPAMAAFYLSVAAKMKTPNLGAFSAEPRLGYIA